MPATILVVDDDRAVCASAARLLRSVGYAVETFTNAATLLNRVPTGRPTCALVDLRMPMMDGLELQAELSRREHDYPVIFMTRQGDDDVAASVQAMKQGAVDVLPKPFAKQQVLEAVDRALWCDVKQQEAKRARLLARERLSRLTERERQVCDYLMAGMLNKQIAAELGIAESTVKVHRSRMMEKLAVDSFIGLVRLLDRAGMPTPAPTTSPASIEDGAA